jgi:hypothetical protein
VRPVRPVRFLLSPNLYSAVLIIFFAFRFHINYFLLFSVMGASPENFSFSPCVKEFFLYRNLFTSAAAMTIYRRHIYINVNGFHTAPLSETLNAVK